MSNLKTTIVGQVEVSKKINNISKRGKDLIKHAVFKGVADVEKEAKKSIQRGSPSGRVYQRYNPRRIFYL